MSKNKYFLYPVTLIFICLLTALVACSSKKRTVLAEIGDEKIYLYEFEDQFMKTVNDLDSAKKTSMEDRKEFLDLLIKFRLKVKDARERGLLESEDIQNDLSEYKKNFISTFLIEKEVIDPNIDRLYERRKFEVRASHVLINLQQDATPEDSVKAYEKAKQVIERLNNGEDFSVVAMEMSDDPTAKQNGGDLYYFTGGMTVPEFEDVVYQMNVGDYTKEPVRTQFGLHVVKLTDKKERNESIRASHILIQDQRDSAGNILDSMATYEKAKQLLERVKNGEDFGTLARENSMDPGSAQKDGDLGFFDRRRMVLPFDSAAFSLKVGEVSDLVRTQFGWHIIKLTEIKEYAPRDQQEDKLKSEFKRGNQYKVEYQKYLDEIRADLDYEIQNDGLNLFLSKMDSTKTVGSHKLDSLFTEQDREIIVAEYKGGEIKVADVIQYLTVNKEYANNAATYNTITRFINGAGEMPLLNIAAEKKGVEDDDQYKALLKEYEDGLLSFKIDQEELWSKIKITDQDLLQYYEANKDKYAYKDGEETKYRDFNEVKSEISNLLQQEKFKEMEKQYVDQLKSKYPVVIKEEVLEKAFTEEG